MATAALTGSPTTTVINLSYGSGTFVDSILHTVGTNTIAIVSFGITVGATVAIKGLDGGGNPYYAVTGSVGPVVSGDGRSYIGSYQINDPNRVVSGLTYFPLTATLSSPTTYNFGGQFYAYPGEQIVFNAIGPGIVQAFIYELAGS